MLIWWLPKNGLGKQKRIIRGGGTGFIPFVSKTAFKEEKSFQSNGIKIQACSSSSLLTDLVRQLIRHIDTHFCEVIQIEDRLQTILGHKKYSTVNINIYKK
jgi:hypothetical protein